MHRLGFLAVLVFVAGCQGPATPVFVDLDKVEFELPEYRPETGAAQPSPPPLPSATGQLSALRGTELVLSETKARVEEAREIIAENRRQALKGLTGALYRSYARQAEAQKNLRETDLLKTAEALWNRALERLSAMLQEHAKDRLPPANKLAVLIGFPFQDPSLSPKPTNPQDVRRYEEAVKAWKTLLAEDREFALAAERLFTAVEEEVDQLRVQIQIDFTKDLNAAADRATAEANEAVASRLPEFVGALSERPDLRLPPAPEKTFSLAAVPAPTLNIEQVQPVDIDLRRQFLEHDLRIWLAQNGYVRASSPLGGVDRTKEFAAWIAQRRPGP